MFAVAMGQEISNAACTKVLEVNALKEMGNTRSCFIRYRNAPALGNNITVHKFFVAIDNADLLYIYTFESPTETWDDSFRRFGTPMLEKIVMAL